MSAQPEQRARVGYLGPQGTFSEEALLAGVEGERVEPIALPSIHEAIVAVRSGDLDLAVVPIENSLEGSVTVTLDTLAEQAPHVQIVGESLLRVHHCLIAPAPVELARIDTVLTHPQVPGQCTRLLRGELAHARVVPASSTAEAVRTVAQEGRPGAAALGTALAAEIYGASVLREGVEDREDNETRFVWLAREGERPLAGAVRGSEEQRWTTSLVFWGAGAGHAGWLVRCLNELADREVNLTKIESRPGPGRIGSYLFFADLSGRIEEEPVADGLRAMRSLCEEVRVLGSYPAASRHA